MSERFVPTFDVLTAMCAQAVSQVNSLDVAVVFDGPLADAINTHFGQTTQKKAAHSIFFLGLSLDQPIRVDGSGAPLTSSLAIDGYIVVRKRGRDEYLKDVEKMLYLSDDLFLSAFKTDVWGEDLRGLVRSVNATVRVRQESSPSMMAHRITYTVTPYRTKK